MQKLTLRAGQDSDIEDMDAVREFVENSDEKFEDLERESPPDTAVESNINSSSKLRRRLVPTFSSPHWKCGSKCQVHNYKTRTWDDGVVEKMFEKGNEQWLRIRHGRSLITFTVDDEDVRWLQPSVELILL